ncbi:hypothetical protein AMATHDRAFT_3443 [Amanita thiersii Skay4041]|uniref:Mus7/MMS22 family-domain-containing protein n=1 Tax=Amanita thiersii Skay4041 TaxID=703135 RepID=A0A2A9NS08_9AGAR|nr:hypothetical protein AMATHDRAFT_3443 [Amanita thiersii Skay4041]
MEDDVVETSDLEELEEQRASTLFQRDPSRTVDIYIRSDGNSPRKRVKLSQSPKQLPIKSSPSFPLSPPATSSPFSLQLFSYSSSTSVSPLTPVGQRGTNAHGMIDVNNADDDVYDSSPDHGSQDPLLIQSDELVLVSDFLEPTASPGSSPRHPAHVDLFPPVEVSSRSDQPLESSGTTLISQTHGIQTQSRLCNTIKPTPSALRSSPQAVSPISNSPPIEKMFNSQNTLASTPTIEKRVGNGRRYSLRTRQAIQIAPYSVDKYQYKKALQGNPEAIIRFQSPERRGRERRNEYEDVGDSFKGDTTQGNEIHTDHVNLQYANPNKGSSHSAITSSYPEILQDLPSTDDEENEDLRTWSNEARRVIRERSAKKAKEQTRIMKYGRCLPLVCNTDRRRSTDGDEEDDNHSSERLYHLPGHDQDYEMPLHKVHNGSLWTHKAPTPGPLERTLSSNVEVGATDNPSLDSSIPIFDVLEQTSDPQSNSSSTDESEPLLDKKSMRALNRMVPAFVVNRLLNQERPSYYRQHQKHRSIPAVSSEEEEPVRPGKTRTRKVSRLGGLQEIRGDSESSEDMRSSFGTPLTSTSQELTQTGSAAEILVHPSLSFIKEPEWEANSIISVSGSESNSDARVVRRTDDEIGEDDINAYLKNDESASEEDMENLIDWMLAGTRTISSDSKQSVSDKHSYKRGKGPRTCQRMIHGINRSGKKNSKQKRALLRFGGTIHGRHQAENLTAFVKESTNRTMEASTRFSDIKQHFPHSSLPVRRSMDRRSKAKGGHAHQSTDAVYLLASESNKRITSGRNEVLSASVDARSDYSHNQKSPASLRDQLQLYHPSVYSGKPSYNQPVEDPNEAHVSMECRDNTQALEDHHFEDSGTEMSHHQIVSDDLIIASLPLGITFHPETFVGKGWLRELIDSLGPKIRTTMPSSYTLRKIILHPEMGLDDFLILLRDICEWMVESATGLPEIDQTQELREWKFITRIVCQYISWFRYAASNEEYRRLTHAVEQHVNEMTHRINQLSLKRASLDASILLFDWFVIELLARLGYQPTPPNISNTFYSSLSLLVGHLVELDVQQAVQAVTSGDILDSEDTPKLSAEMWVILIHLLGDFAIVGEPRRAPHLLWRLVLGHLQNRMKGTSFEDSEVAWKTIFCLCALSQFSVHGISTNQFGLPASWELVVFAMKTCLSADPQVDEKLPLVAHLEQDKYIGVLTHRCLLLCDLCKWKLDNASELFNELAKIFRSRKFANLRHEKPEYPLFMLHNDWSLLSQIIATDSAFVSFLKLIFRAAVPDGEMRREIEISPRLRKLLSLATPLGSLPFSKATPPSKNDLSMLFNRLSAVALGLYLDPASHKTRFSHARTYVIFANADTTTRMAVIRGMMNLAILSQKIGIQIDAIAEWIAEIATSLADELKAHTPSPTNTKLAILYICIQAHLEAVRRILDSFSHTCQYPEPALITSLKPLLSNQELFNARSTALPAPERPHVAVEVNTESQEEYNASFDFDFNDPTLIAVLGVPEYKVHEEKMYNAIHVTDLYWLSRRNLMNLINELNNSDRELAPYDIKKLDRAIYCWLGCADQWSAILEPKETMWKKITSEALRRRVDLGVVVQLLKLHPLVYSTQMDMFLEAFFESLVVDQITIEHEYVSMLLSIDGLQHPLFQHMDRIEKFDHGSYNIHESQYLVLKLPILQVVLSNLDEIISRVEESNDQANAGSSNSQQFVDYCIKGFSAMRGILSSLSPQSNARISYTKWCKQLFHFLQGLKHISSHPRLDYWISWGRSLDI